MKYKNKLLCVIGLFVVSLMITASCKSANQGVKTPNITPSKRSEFTPTIISNDLTDLLSGVNCQLPCLLGIIPGMSTLEDAQLIFINTGFYGYVRDDVAFYDQFVYINSEIHLHISILLNHDDTLITRMILSLDIRDQDIFQQRYSNFQPVEILSDNGVPENLYFSMYEGGRWKSSNLILVFAEESIMYIYRSRITADELCLSSNETDTSHITIIVDDLSTPSETIWVNPRGSDVLSIKEAFGVNEQEFYDTIMKDPESCFDLIISDP